MNRKQFKVGFRLHWMSWLTLVLLSLIMTVIAVPGIVVPGSEKDLPIQHLASDHFQYVALSHGWPNEFMRSECSKSLANTIAWTSPRAWPMGNTIFSFELKSLIIDLLVAGVIVAVGTLAVEFWCRRRKGAWFSLFDMLVVVGLIAAVTSWYQSHASDHAAETQALCVGEGRGRMYFIGEQRLGTPDWLTRLVGGQSQIRFCKHVTRLELGRHASWAFGSHKPDLFPIDDDKVKALSGFKRVEVLEFTGPTCPELPSSVAKLKRLHTIRIEHENAYVCQELGFASPPATGTPSVVYNDRLRAMNEKKICSFDAIQKLDQLEQLTNLELDLGYVSKSALRELPALSKLTNLSLASYEIFVEDLNALERYKNLKEVRLSISATNQELEHFQRTHPQMKISWDRSADLDAWQIIHRRIKNWGRIEDSYRQERLDVYYGGDEKGYPNTLDLTALKLTKERLGLLINTDVDLASIRSISVGRVDSVQTLNQLVKRCSSLREVELYAGCPNEVSDQFILPRRWGLTVLQGDLSVEDLHVLIKKHQLSELYIHDSTLSNADFTALEEAWPDVFIDHEPKFEPEEEDRDGYPIRQYFVVE